METHQQNNSEWNRREALMLATAGVTTLLVAGLDDIERLLTKVLDPKKYAEIMQKNNGQFPPSLRD